MPAKEVDDTRTNSDVVKVEVSGTNNCTIYLTCDIPCVDCTRAIINAGIKVIFCERGEGAKGDHWDGHRERSIQMLKEAHRTVWYYGDSKPFIDIGEVRA